jgi:hypothetical protein
LKISKTIHIISFLILANAGEMKAQDTDEFIDRVGTKKRYSPDYFKIQHAGNIGFMSIGLGYDWWCKKAQSTLLYGYVPESKGNATIHTFTIKNDFRLYYFTIKDNYNIQPTLGFSVSLEPGENSYMRVPDKYPEGYYGPNNFYACINLGLKSSFALNPERYFSALEVYFEINTLADYIYYNIIAQEDRSNTIASLALGVNVFF